MAAKNRQCRAQDMIAAAKIESVLRKSKDLSGESLNHRRAFAHRRLDDLFERDGTDILVLAKNLRVAGPVEQRAERRRGFRRRQQSGQLVEQTHFRQ